MTGHTFIALCFLASDHLYMKCFVMFNHINPGGSTGKSLTDNPELFKEQDFSYKYRFAM